MRLEALLDVSMKKNGPGRNFGVPENPNFVLNEFSLKVNGRKVVFYPYTDTVREHAPHVDYDFDHYGAIFALNTCDGFTRLTDGTKIESVENRFFIFNASQFHNSSTTSDAQSRYNINFNFL